MLRAAAPMLQLINPAFRCYVAPNPDSEVEALVIVAVILLAVPFLVIGGGIFAGALV